MANVIKLSKGLDINLKGKAEKNKIQLKSNGKYAYTLNQDRHDGAFTVSVKDADGGSVLITCFSADT